MNARQRRVAAREEIARDELVIDLRAKLAEAERLLVTTTAELADATAKVNELTILVARLEHEALAHDAARDLTLALAAQAVDFAQAERDFARRQVRGLEVDRNEILARFRRLEAEDHGAAPLRARLRKKTEELYAARAEIQRLEVVFRDERQNAGFHGRGVLTMRKREHS